MKPGAINPGFPVLALPSLAVLLALGACDEVGTQTAAPNATRQAVEASRPSAANSTPESRTAGAESTIGKAVDASRAASAKAPDQLHLDDALIVAKVITGLAADKNLSALRIKVEVRDGVVTLRGPAPSAATRARAEEIARNVQGVNSVNNQLNVQG